MNFSTFPAVVFCIRRVRSFAEFNLTICTSYSTGNIAIKWSKGLRVRPGPSVSPASWMTSPPGVRTNQAWRGTGAPAGSLTAPASHVRPWAVAVAGTPASGEGEGARPLTGGGLVPGVAAGGTNMGGVGGGTGGWHVAPAGWDACVTCDPSSAAATSGGSSCVGAGPAYALVNV